jgi:hypothetical protein
MIRPLEGVERALARVSVLDVKAAEPHAESDTTIRQTAAKPAIRDGQ